MKVELINYTPNAEEIVASAAKLCYSNVGVEEIMKKQTPESVGKFLNHLMKLGHESPIEHVSFTFAIEGVSRVLSHQLVRHRLASYSQQSQRYVKLDQFEYIVPPAIKNNKKANWIFKETMERDQRAYSLLIMNLMEDYCNNYVDSNDYDYLDYSSKVEYVYEKHNKKYKEFEKMSIEDARYVFPNACETKIVVTMNARSLMNFFKHRDCNRAQWEIKELSREMMKQVKEIAPTIFKYAGADCRYGKCQEGNMTCGNPIGVE